MFNLDLKKISLIIGMIFYTAQELKATLLPYSGPVTHADYYLYERWRGTVFHKDVVVARCEFNTWQELEVAMAKHIRNHLADLIILDSWAHEKENVQVGVPKRRKKALKEPKESWEIRPNIKLEIRTVKDFIEAVISIGGRPEMLVEAMVELMTRRYDDILVSVLCLASCPSDVIYEFCSDHWAGLKQRIAQEIYEEYCREIATFDGPPFS